EKGRRTESLPQERGQRNKRYRVLAIELFSKNINPVVEEFRQAELSCIIATTKTANPRIEWKKIGSQGTTYVYFDGKLSSRTSLTIYNVTRADKGIYRCEVVAPDDANLVAEINVNLTVHVKPVAPKCRVPSSVPVGKPATLYCQEQEGFPEPTYSWYRNDETLPPNSKASTKFQNSSFTVNPKTGMLVSRWGEDKEKEGWGCPYWEKDLEEIIIQLILYFIIIL
ncbi:hypothetical protein E2320_007136, partial [Naja naja]